MDGDAVLRLHRSERADALVPPLAEVLAVPPDDPFATDVVAVPTRGVERWLAQRLSHRLGAGPGPAAEREGGIAAAIRFTSRWSSRKVQVCSSSTSVETQISAGESASTGRWRSTAL